jgi:hypothetical protein
MEPLELLRAKIPGFPGYDDEIERRHSDEYVRSYLGEALADLAARYEPPPEVRLDELILRVGFADPRDFAAKHVLAAQNGQNDGGQVAVADVAIVELADRAATLDATSLAGYLDEVTAALDQREAAIRAASLKMT